MTGESRKLGTFEGVFTPTTLTILGVIMYLRLGWVVGNAGFGGALLIILLAKLVTVCTGLSLASTATNIRVGAGGSYALISRSLGLEVGSSIGIPLYMSQTLGGAMYITGFTEGWLAIFPQHEPLHVSVLVLIGLLLISLVGARFAMRSQYFVILIIFLSLVSFFLGSGEASKEIVVWGEFTKAPFWVVFAIFFPAVTGIEAGASMSGDVADSRKSLPKGILSAIGITLAIYIGVAYWLDRMASPEMLTGNYTIMLDLSKWRFLVVAGILGATLSSALGSIVGAPRTLMALGQDKVIPLYRTFAKKSKNGEPMFATVFTGLAILISLVLGDLNSIAPLLTMFFLITYATINLAVAIEKGIGIPSFRPLFDIPLIVPVIGALWSIIVMFMINPVFAGLAWILILVFYIVQVKRELRTPWGDVRSGLFSAISEWAAKTSTRMPRHAKTWKPNILIPVEDPGSWTHLMVFIRDIVFPSGTVRLFSVKIMEDGVQSVIEDIVSKLFREKKPDARERHERIVEELDHKLEALVEPVKAEGIFATATAIECHHFLEGISIITQVLRSMYFPSNIIFLTMSADSKKDFRLKQMIAIAIRETLGIAILSLHPKNSFGNEKQLNVWLRRTSPNKDLAVLIALQVKKNWNGNIRFITIVQDEEEKEKALFILEKLMDRARLPVDTESAILTGEFTENLQTAPLADLNIFGISNELNCDTMRDISTRINTSCLFVKDSGEESMLA